MHMRRGEIYHVKSRQSQNVFCENAKITETVMKLHVKGPCRNLHDNLLRQAKLIQWRIDSDHKLQS